MHRFRDSVSAVGDVSHCSLPKFDSTSPTAINTNLDNETLVTAVMLSLRAVERSGCYWCAVLLSQDVQIR